MKKVLLLCIVLSMVLFMVNIASASSATVNGYVTDSQCGAKGAKAGHADCMNKCLSKGAKAVIVTDDGQKIMNVDNPEALKGHEGHHVSVTGDVNGDTIHVGSVKMI